MKRSFASMEQRRPTLRELIECTKEVMNKRAEEVERVIRENGCGGMKRNHKEDGATLATLKGLVSQAGGGDGLSKMPTDTLRNFLGPVIESLQQLDAESLLTLKRAEKGARLFDDVNVKPIHNQVKPQYDASCVRYIHITEVPDEYSVGIFVFPPFSKIPLHDHPGMCVLSRLLYGELQCLSFDLLRADDPRNDTEEALKKRQKKKADNGKKPVTESKWSSFFRLPGQRKQEEKHEEPELPPGSVRALKNPVTYLHAPSVSVLYPYEGNLHEFFAGPHGAAVLDILLPPYDVEAVRDCTFYEIHEDDESDDDDDDEEEEDVEEENKTNGKDDGIGHKEICWVYPTDQPEEFHCLSGKYGKLGGDHTLDDIS